MLNSNNFPIFFSELSLSFDSISSFFLSLWAELNHLSLIFDIATLVGIAFFSYLIQRYVQKRYGSFIEDEKSPDWSQKIIYTLLSFSAPLIAFVLFSFAMSIRAEFTAHLEIYKFAIKLTLIWLLWTLAVRFISDVFVRVVFYCTLIPLLILLTFGLSTPVIHYLDSLGFSLAGVHLSVFVMLKMLFIATCLFSIARMISQNVVTLIESHNKISVEIRDLMQNLFNAILYTTVVLITLDLVGIDLKSLAIVGGAIGIGIGLGLQKIAANFISGIIILFEQRVKVGHLVEIPGGVNPGWVRHLGTRSAVIDTGDGKELFIPNEELLTKTVIDWTSKDKKSRIDLRIKVTFRSNLEKAKEIMINAAADHPLCSNTSPPTCYLEKFTDNGAEFLLQFWIDDVSKGKMDFQNDVLLTIWKSFAEENIEHPSPPLLINT